jgi:hypothetical protein
VIEKFIASGMRGCQIAKNRIQMPHPWERN